jgi:hypothetical protein
MIGVVIFPDFQLVDAATEYRNYGYLSFAAVPSVLATAEP